MSVEGRRQQHKCDGDSHNGSAADSDSARGSSILSSPTTPQQRLLLRFFLSGCSAVGSALALGARCRGFESRHSDHQNNAVTKPNPLCYRIFPHYKREKHFPKNHSKYPKIIRFFKTMQHTCNTKWRILL